MKLTFIIFALTVQHLAAVTELEIVAATLILEAGCDGKIGMECVNEVIHTRSRLRRQSLTVVCLARKQFSAWNRRSVQSGLTAARKSPLWSMALKIAGAEVTKHVPGATHYWAHERKADPWGFKVITVIKSHTFCFGK